MNNQVQGQLLLAVLMLAGTVTTIENPDQAGTTTIREAPNGSIDIFRPDGSRVGFGTQRQDGSMDLFRPDGSRLGYIQPASPSDRHGSTRIILTPSRRR